MKIAKGEKKRGEETREMRKGKAGKGVEQSASK